MSTIPCPVCQTQIPFDPHLLIQGSSFTCGQCYSVISLAQESMPVAKESLEQLDEIKKQGKESMQNNQP